MENKPKIDNNKNNMQVYFIRHGETRNNKEHRFIGITDMPLNDRGKNQAICLWNPMSKINIDKIYSSPFLRTMMTADQIRGNRNIEIIPIDGLREINCGMWEGLNRSEIQSKWPGMIDLWENEPERLQIPGGETFQEVQDRAVESFVNVIRENFGKCIVFTSHMLTIQLIIAKLLGININDVWNMKRLENTSITSMDIWNNGMFKIIRWGDNSHLPYHLRNEYVKIAGFVQTNFKPKYGLSYIEGSHYSNFFKVGREQLRY